MCLEKVRDSVDTGTNNKVFNPLLILSISINTLPLTLITRLYKYIFQAIPAWCKFSSLVPVFKGSAEPSDPSISLSAF